MIAGQYPSLFSTETPNIDELRAKLFLSEALSDEQDQSNQQRAFYGEEDNPKRWSIDEIKGLAKRMSDLANEIERFVTPPIVNKSEVRAAAPVQLIVLSEQIRAWGELVSAISTAVALYPAPE